MAMWLKKELNFDVCEHINKLRVKEFNEEFEKKKQEDAQDLKETIQEFTEFVNNNDKGRDHIEFDVEQDEIFGMFADHVDNGESFRELLYGIFDLFIEWNDEICEGRKKIMYDMLYNNLDEFFQIVVKHGADVYDIDENEVMNYDGEYINWDVHDLRGLTKFIDDIMEEDNFVRHTSKKIWYNPLTGEDVYAVDKRCKAYKRGKLCKRTGFPNLSDDVELFKIVTNLWNRRDQNGVKQIVEKWIKD